MSHVLDGELVKTCSRPFKWAQKRTRRMTGTNVEAPLPLLVKKETIAYLYVSPGPTTAHLDVHSFVSRLKNLLAEALYFKFFHSSRWMVS